MAGKITQKIKKNGKIDTKPGTNGNKASLKDVRQKLPRAKPVKLDTTRFEGDRAAVERELQRLREALQDLPEVNIEEADPLAAIRSCGTRLFHFHVADSNRWYPGAGHLDFGTILRTLEECGYPGWAPPQYLVCVASIG